MLYNKITKSKQYKPVFEQGKKYSTHFFLVIYLTGPLENQTNTLPCSAGIIASKKVGNAVVRNFCKRRLRAALAELTREIDFSKTCKFVIIAKPQLATIDYTTFKNALLKFLKHCCR